MFLCFGKYVFQGGGEIALKTDDLEVVASMQRRAEEVEAHSITLKPRGRHHPLFD